MSRQEPDLREQLLQARAKVRRQLEILSAGPVGPDVGFQSGMVEKLTGILRELDQKINEDGSTES